jgi:flagellar hook-basal body complex protein FliE
MTFRTTVAIDSDLRKIIKKLAAWLDISQGEVIRRAIAEYEKAIINKDVYPNTSKDKIKKEIATILQEATDAVWEDDIKTREIQEKLKKGPSSIDEVILNNWDFGLEL